MMAGFGEGPDGEERVVVVDDSGYGNEVEGRADTNAGERGMTRDHPFANTPLAQYPFRIRQCGVHDP